MIQIAHDKIITFDDDGHYFSGSSDNNIYLANRYSPLEISVFSKELIFGRSIRFDDTLRERVAWRALRVLVDSPAVYLYENLSPAILITNLNTRQLVPRLIGNTSLNRFTPLDREAYLSVSFNQKRKVNEIVKRYIKKESTLPFSSILEKQKDGVFCTDGMICVDRVNGQCSYVYFYRNQFVMFDSTGKVQNRPHTIDTLSVVNFDTVGIKSNSTVKIGTPAIVVNRKSFLSNGKLYIQSTAITTDDHEDDQEPIDVYSSVSGEYLFSYYVPEFRGEQLTSFFVCNDRLFVFYGKYLVSYKT